VRRPEIRRSCATATATWSRTSSASRSAAGADQPVLRAGMLLNVIASMGLEDPSEPWAKRLLEGCKE
jgi:hypothetical protein